MKHHFVLADKMSFLSGVLMHAILQPRFFLKFSYNILYDFFRYFPALLKDHSSHDVLLLCISCHLKCADYETELRQRLVVECNAPLDSGKDAKRHVDQDLAKVVSAAKYVILLI